MKKPAFLIVFGIAATLFPAGFARMDPGSGAPGYSARITMVDGSSRMARIDGVGCSVSICSRTLIEGRDENVGWVKMPLDSIAEIRGTTAHDALFVMKDGSQRRLSLVKDFRVLYLGGTGVARVDLAQVKSVDFRH